MIYCEVNESGQEEYKIERSPGPYIVATRGTIPSEGKVYLRASSFSTRRYVS